MIKRRHIVPALKAVALLLAVGVTAGLASMLSSDGKLLSVQSSSMAPAISKGELVNVKRVPYEKLAVGDVITYVSDDRQSTVTHRVVALMPEDPAGNNVITKGDANPNEDAPIEASQITGKVEHSIPYLGHALDFLRTWPGLVILVYIPALIILITEIRSLAAFFRLKHYVLPEYWARTHTAGRLGRNSAIAIATVLASVAVAIPARAELQSTAVISGSIITIADMPEPPPEPEQAPALPEPPPPPPPDETQTNPVKPTIAKGDITIRRAFIICREGEDEASEVEIVLDNSTLNTLNISGWYLRAGDEKLVTFPDETLVLERNQFDVQTPIVDDISYPNGKITLHNEKDEQIHEMSWEVNTDRNCRIQG